MSLLAAHMTVQAIELFISLIPIKEQHMWYTITQAGQLGCKQQMRTQILYSSVWFVINTNSPAMSHSWILMTVLLSQLITFIAKSTPIFSQSIEN